MKTLYLLRHAKSSWDDPELKDFERPLSSRGIKDVPVMSGRFAEKGNLVECIIFSPAIRAKSTAQRLAKNIGFPQDDMISNAELYFACRHRQHSYLRASKARSSPRYLVRR